MSNFVIFDVEMKDYDCVLTDFKGLANTFPLTAGAPLQDSFPDDASFAMSPDFPNNTNTPDCLKNTNMVMVASENLVNYLRKMKVPNVEFLPVSILDHRSKPINSKYAIVHPIEPLDVLDLERSVVEFSFILPDEIDSISSITLKESLVSPSSVMFRCARLANFIFVRREFATKITEAGFSGFVWRELEDCRL